MSDPLTNVEIEDVLESIRRLVAAGDSSGHAVPKPEDRARDRLVLTPALRVDRDADRSVEDTPPARWRTEDRRAAATPAETGGADRTANTKDSEELLAGILAATSSKHIDDAEFVDLADDDESDADRDNDAAPRSRLASSDLARLMPESFDSSEDDEAEADDHRDPATNDARQDIETEEPPMPTFVASPRQRLEDTIAELEAAVTFSGQDFEPDGTEPSDWSTVTANRPGRLHLVFPDAEEAAEEDSQPEEATTDDNWEAAMDDDTPAEPPESSESVAPLRLRPSERTRRSPEAPQRSFRVYEGDRESQRAEVAQSESQESRLAARPDLDDDEDLAAYLGNTGAVDEEAMRELVGQIVREELQGVLGERITRNVRKLVRREIHRILNSQDFD
ncbi:hypothetical protein [Histidinibacterium aquaticum]|uniref:Uncharacterized protein n=1 Tax=Histidinibacterium aquaticum TaxID=2613962 RepID=A0A5J5GPU4_9RHOB|nr:hypothetical protein [Histidinibacterium aquaticum]KAA9010190.1 hypothetical protein F3S47_02765 [Histidinibacterium aquaticum]